MKRTRKGFTLVELLIVVSIIGVLATMMTMSSTEAIDKAGANAIVSNLNSMKTAAMSMFMDRPEFAKLDIQFATTTATTTVSGVADETVEKVLAKYLGKTSASLIDSTNTKYGLVGKTDSGVTQWFVVYKITTADSAGVKAQLANNAGKADLLGASGVTYDLLTDDDVTNYVKTDSAAALKVF